MAEFVLSAITFLFVLLGIIQLALVMNAYTLVRYAAYNAARAASVSGGDSEKMQEAARVSLLAVFPRHGVADTVSGFAKNYKAAKATDTDSSYTAMGVPITAVKVVTDSPPCGHVATFDDPADTQLSVITVQVVHQYELVIPLVNRILFYLYRQFKKGDFYHGQTVDNLAAVTDKLRRTGNLLDIEYRIPVVAHYTIRMQSDYVPPGCGVTTTTTTTTSTSTTTSTTTTTTLCGTVNNPKVDGLPMDHCYNYNADCGGKAANEYCKSIGCLGTSGYNTQISQKTKTFGSRQVCDTAGCWPNCLCESYTYIKCFE